MSADALQQLVEVVAIARARRVLEPLVVEGEALDQVLVQARRGPLAELDAPLAAHAVADGEDGRQAVVQHLARDLAIPLAANY